MATFYIQWHHLRALFCLSYKTTNAPFEPQELFVLVDTTFTVSRDCQITSVVTDVHGTVLTFRVNLNSVATIESINGKVHALGVVMRTGQAIDCATG